jgi:hypothetical protein
MSGIYTAEEILEIVDVAGSYKLKDGDFKLDISAAPAYRDRSTNKNINSYYIIQGSPQGGYDADIYTYQRALRFIQKELRNHNYS